MSERSGKTRWIDLARRCKVMKGFDMFLFEDVGVG